MISKLNEYAATALPGSQCSTTWGTVSQFLKKPIGHFEQLYVHLFTTSLSVANCGCLTTMTDTTNQTMQLMEHSYFFHH